jgi:histidinol phosphatase-like PHP family hydrolase
MASPSLDQQPHSPSRGDINAVVGGLLRDLAFVQTSKAKMFGYKRAAAAVLSLEEPLTTIFGQERETPRIPGIGPASTRVILEVLGSGESQTVEAAVASSSLATEVQQRRSLRQHFLSRAEVLRILADRSYSGPSADQYGGDVQMHSEWSDGASTLEEIIDTCVGRGYRFAAVTDHSHGLKIAGGMTRDEALRQHKAIEHLNRTQGGHFWLIHGIEANIGSDGQLDLTDDEAGEFELVLAAPHSHLRKVYDQTERLLTAIRNPRVRILAHPRGRIKESRAGVIADWDAVFAVAAEEGVAIEIDGDPARQDLDFTLAARALAAGCLFALDSDAHTIEQLAYAETAVAHARLAAIPATRIINCWSNDRLNAWMISRGVEATSARHSSHAHGQRT